jgi:large-conductance mechanosensitive channel
VRNSHGKEGEPQVPAPGAAVTLRFPTAAIAIEVVVTAAKKNDTQCFKDLDFRSCPYSGSENAKHQERRVRQNFLLHENYRDDDPVEAGSDRSFGCTVGTVLVLIGATKVLVAGALSTVACFILAPGVMLLLVGIFAPARLSAINRIWLKLGAVIAKVINPILLALLFFFVVTPMAFVMRIAGKRPLRLALDHAASSYWTYRNASRSEPSSMRQQF